MEPQKLTKNKLFKHALLLGVLLLFTISCIGISMDSDIDLGGGYYYVQDYPQCICHYPKPGKVILPIGECDDIVVRVQYNDSIIIATSTPSYYAPDSTVYEIRKETNSIRIISDGFPNTDKKVFKEIKNSKRYCSPLRNSDGLKMDKN